MTTGPSNVRPRCSAVAPPIRAFRQDPTLWRLPAPGVSLRRCRRSRRLVRAGHGASGTQLGYGEPAGLAVLVGPGVFGGSSLIGLVSASEDGVGRRYPLVVGLSQPPQILVSPPLETDALSRRLDHAEAIVRKLIEEDLSADEAMQIAELDAPDLVCAPSTTNSLAPASSIWWLDAARWTSLRGPPDTGDFLRMTAVWYDTAQTCPETGTLPTCLTETVDRP